jgi:NAD(P)H dehydrogenase (quinone)
LKVFIVYAHPSEDSFTRYVRDSFVKGLEAAGHSYMMSDLYKMGFATNMSEAEHLREANFRAELPVLSDVQAEQHKINDSNTIVLQSKKE